MRPNWLMTVILCVLFGILGCEAASGPESQLVAPQPNEIADPFEETSLPIAWDPCATSVGWKNLNYSEFVDITNQSSFGLTATFAHYDSIDRSLYVVGNSLLSLFRVNRLNAAGSWQEIYQRNLSDFCQPYLQDCFLEGTEAYDDQNRLLFFSIFEDVVSINPQGLQTAQQLPVNYRPVTSVAVDSADARLYISYPGGIASRSYASNDWQVEVLTVDLPEQPLERIWIFRDTAGLTHLCAFSTDGIACRGSNDEWSVLPVLEAGQMPGTLQDIVYDAASDELFLLSDNRIWFSEGLNGWKIWYQNAVFQIDEIEPAGSGDLYVRSGRQFWLIDEAGRLSQLILLPFDLFDVYSGYDIREFDVIPGEPVGLVFEDDDGCPNADQLCLASEVYLICLQ